MNNIAGIILAGGNSKRFGTDKSELNFNGLSLLQRIISEHKKILEEVYVIGKEDNEIDNAIGIRDKISNIGPIGGLFTAMHNIDTNWYLLSPCDMPFLMHTDLNKIIKICEKRSVDAIVAKSQKGIEPLVAIYNRSIFSTIEKNINNAKYSIRGIFKEIKIQYLNFDEKIFEKDPFFNINYRDDYMKALQL